MPGKSNIGDVLDAVLRSAGWDWSSDGKSLWRVAFPATTRGGIASVFFFFCLVLPLPPASCPHARCHLFTFTLVES